MDNYSSIFDPIPWEGMWISFLQSILLYWVVLVGLKLLGRRSLGQLGPQELILLLLISESTDVGLTPQDSGFWGSVASVIALLLTVFIVDRVPVLNDWLEANPVHIIENGQVDEAMLKKYNISHKDLARSAREHGVYNPTEFDLLVLESDGKLTGVLKSQNSMS